MDMTYHPNAPEFELPDTTLARDIENCVFQAIILQILSKTEGIGLLEGNFIDLLLGRQPVERIRGIIVEQDSQSHSVNIKIEINVFYGVSIPKKAEEIQTKVISEVIRLTGLHVSSVHIVFKNLVLSEEDCQAIKNRVVLVQQSKKETPPVNREAYEAYSDEF